MTDLDRPGDPPPSPPTEWDDLYTGSTADYEPPDPDLLAIAAGLAPGRSLDVGCGAGGLLLALAESGWKASGIDISERAIASARALLAARGVEAELTVADAASWRPDARFDLVTSSFALPEGDERTAALRTIGDAVAPGGTVALKEFDHSMSRHSHFRGFDLVTIEELERAFEGFVIARLEVVQTPVHEHAGVDHRAEVWTAALLEARAPGTRRQPGS